MQHEKSATTKVTQNREPLTKIFCHANQTLSVKIHTPPL